MNILGRVFCSVIILVVSGASGRASGVLPKEDGAYQVARLEMIRLGYRPFRVLPAGTSDLDEKYKGFDNFRSRFPELAFCDGTGLDDCIFVFQRGTRDFVEIGTTGEALSNLTVVRVERVTLDQAQQDYNVFAH